MSVTLQTSPMERRLVLMVDDEAAIQDLIKHEVSRLGLIALAVSDGAAAIIAVEAHGAELVCVVLDITMPVMNGVEAARVIRKLKPDLAIVLMSGYVPSRYVDDINQLGLAGMLHKPFSLAVLREVLLHAADDSVVSEMG